MPEFAAFVPEITADGSFTFYSSTFGEQFHSRKGARQEAALKFVGPTQLREKAKARSHLCLLDICYGLGYNTAVAVATIWAANPHCHIELVALELDPTVPLAALQIWQQFAIGADDRQQGVPWPEPVLKLLAGLVDRQTYQSPKINAQLLLGDARQQLQTVRRSGFQADAIFLDPFSPPHCPQLWTMEFLDLAARCLCADGRLATYSCAAAVRHALLAANLQIAATPPIGRKSPGTIASWQPLPEFPPFSSQEIEHLQTRAAIPYRDRTLSASAEDILKRRETEQQSSPLEPTSRWKKRWST